MAPKSKRKSMSRSPPHNFNNLEIGGLNMYQNFDFEKAVGKQELSVSVSNENLENSVLYDYIQKMDPCKLMSQHGAGGHHVHEHLHSHEKKASEGGMDMKQLQRDLISTNQMCKRLVTTYENREAELRLNQPTMCQVFANSLPTIVKC